MHRNDADVETIIHKIMLVAVKFIYLLRVIVCLTRSAFCRKKAAKQIYGKRYSKTCFATMGVGNGHV